MTRQNAPDDVDSLLDELCAKTLTERQAAKIFDRVLGDVVQRYHQSMFWGDRLLTLDKSADFYEDQDFRKALTQADSSTGMTQYASPHGISWRYNTLIWAARICLDLAGDYVECGVYRGDMTWMITQTVDLQTRGKIFYIYDTFSGFDTKHSSEADFPEVPGFFHFVADEYRVPGIEDHVRSRFRNQPHIVVTKGVVPDILHEVAPDRIAFLHLDMNSPRAETGALEILFERITPGGIIIFDDYGWKAFHKQKEAADQFMAAHNQIILELPTGQGMLVKR